MRISYHVSYDYLDLQDDKVKNFSIDIYTVDRDFIYRKYGVDDDTCLDRKQIKLSSLTAKKIEKLIETSTELFELNSYIENNTDQGYTHQFYITNGIHNREIHTWNLDKGIYKKYGNSSEIINQETILLNFFKELSSILKDDNVILKLYECTFKR